MFVIAVCMVLVMSMASTQADGNVAFTFGRLIDAKVSDGNYVNFDKTIYIEGFQRGDDPCFTAPRGGVYVFHIYAVSNLARTFNLRLIKNDEGTGYIVSSYGSSFGYSPSGNTAILRLLRYDRICVKSVGDSWLYADKNRIYTTFTGYRIGD